MTPNDEVANIECHIKMLLDADWLASIGANAQAPNHERDLNHRCMRIFAEVDRLRALVREHAVAAAIFQPGGVFHQRACLRLGRSAVVEGIAWLVKALDSAERDRDEALALVPLVRALRFEAESEAMAEVGLPVAFARALAALLAAPLPVTEDR